jgi:pimeloyl-ACP methyl ester carboxylesterase
MAKVLANGIRFHCQTKGEGPDVILIHGVTASLAMWYTSFFPALSQKFRVTTYDLRGHGLSGMPPTGYTSRHMADDLAALMDALNIPNARLVGHSYGGTIALHFSLLHPDRVNGVVALDSGLPCLRRLRAVKEWIGWKVYGAQLKEYGLGYDDFLEMDQNEDVTELFRKTFSIPMMFGFRKGSSRATPRFEKLINETSIGREFREPAGLTEERLPEITAPVLAFYGATSPYAPLGAHLSRVLPNCRHETHAEFGHFYVLREPGAAMHRISNFLDNPAEYLRQDAADVAARR